MSNPTIVWYRRGAHKCAPLFCHSERMRGISRLFVRLSFRMNMRNLLQFVWDSSFRLRCIQNDIIVIPNRDLWSSVRNLHRPIRNGGDCTLAWREILQSKAFQNDIFVISNACVRSHNKLISWEILHSTAFRSEWQWSLQEILPPYGRQNDSRVIPSNSEESPEKCPFLLKFFLPHSRQNDNRICKGFIALLMLRSEWHAFG